MRAIVLSVVLVAGPALAQQTPTTVPPAPYVPTFGTQAVPASAPPPIGTPASAAPPAPQQQAQPAPAPDMDSAQIPQAIDPMADLISQSGQTTDEEEAEAVANKPAPRHRAMILPIPPPEPEAPATPGGYLTTAQVYELRVKGSIAAAQNLQGPLDGGWRVAGADGTQIYALQIVDKAGGYGELEGAWRDVRRPGTVGSTGLIEDLRRDGGDIFVRFSPKVGQSSTLTLRPAGYERWSGELVENGETTAVVAEHVLPQAPPGYEAQGRGPYVWPPRVAAPSRPAAAPACSTKGKKGKALKAAKAKCAAAARKGKASAAKKGKGGKAVAAKRGKAAAGKKSSTKKKKR